MNEDHQHQSDRDRATATEAVNEPSVSPIDRTEDGETVRAQSSAALEDDLAATRDDLLRALAEIENTRRRGERAAQDARTYAIDKFARDLLPVVDSLGRALSSVEARDSLDEATRTLLAGVEMTEKALLDAFERHGLRRFGVKGDAFDPNLHQAIAQAPSPTVPSGAIAEVMQSGFALGERTLRAAMVVVSLGPAADAPANGGGHVDIKV